MPLVFSERWAAVTAVIVEATAAKLAAANANAASTITAVVAPSADPVSIQIATAFNALGNQYTATVKQEAAALGHVGPAGSEHFD